MHKRRKTWNFGKIQGFSTFKTERVATDVRAHGKSEKKQMRKQFFTFEEKKGKKRKKIYFWKKKKNEVCTQKERFIRESALEMSFGGQKIHRNFTSLVIFLEKF